MPARAAAGSSRKTSRPPTAFSAVGEAGPASCLVCRGEIPEGSRRTVTCSTECRAARENELRARNRRARAWAGRCVECEAPADGSKHLCGPHRDRENARRRAKNGTATVRARRAAAQARARAEGRCLDCRKPAKGGPAMRASPTCGRGRDPRMAAAARQRGLRLSETLGSHPRRPWPYPTITVNLRLLDEPLGFPVDSPYPETQEARISATANG